MAKKKKTALIIVSIILAIILLLAFAVFLFVKGKLDLIQYSDGSGGVEEIQVEEIEIDTSDLPETAPGEIGDSSIVSDPNVLNILLLGTDERTQDFSSFARSDTMMLLSLNLKTHTAKLVSLERGMGVPIVEGKYAGQYDWLTHCFQYGGADLVMKEVRECFRIDVTKYVRTSFYAFIRIIDVIGGVEVTLTQAEANYVNSAQNDQVVSAGTNHLNGAAALAYSRCRKIDSDWQRIKRQRNVIQACMDKVSVSDISSFNTLADQILPLVQTNLSQWEIFTLCLQLPNFLNVQFEQMTIPAQGTYGSMRGMGNRSMFSVNFDQNAKLLQEFFYGYAAE